MLDGVGADQVVELVPVLGARLGIGEVSVVERHEVNIEDGRIKTIYTAMFYPVATLAVPNWPPFDGNWPVQPPAK